MRGSTGPLELASGVRQVRKFIEANGESRFAPWNEKPEEINRSGANRVANRAGFKRRVQPEAPEEEYYILPETFRDELCRGFDWKALAQELVRRKILIPSPNNGPLSQAIRIPALERLRAFTALPQQSSKATNEKRDSILEFRKPNAGRPSR
jgi:putative DNA primase/helicase